MVVFRLYEKIGGRSPLGFGNGEGRWNKKGVPLIYTANSLSLAMLEHYAIKGSVVSKRTWEVAVIKLPDDIPFIEALDLPEDWDMRPYPQSTLNFGTNWALEQVSFCVAVPSIRIPLFRFPEEFNLLLNPLHPDFKQKTEVLEVKSVDFQLNKPVLS